MRQLAFERMGFGVLHWVENSSSCVSGRGQSPKPSKSMSLHLLVIVIAGLPHRIVGRIQSEVLAQCLA